ncbi:SMC-Scp complex subunit ScpB [Peptoniphilus indolicus]|uniref:Segregation and condensation protein B n=2 Tax=Peptoniphilus indolicus TaxID=33030 RepID=G4D6P2_9FIRM|nr:SMC-Scp complex subunit ScpB [Peptoniphilus indolicus]EGY76436.1 segregation and condensation protein B [Peptoniphilus indolicus ATCC 29427]SUB76057.1 Segregation and condensation protein B [Peptoniphilus indolicus]
MEIESLSGIIESILFAWAEPVSIKELAQAVKTSDTNILAAINFLKDKYTDKNSGLRLTDINGAYTLSTKPENYDYVNEFVTKKNIKSLSGASLEVLSIVAYKQPITKIEIEEIRGVKCDTSLKNLVDLNLIAITGQLQKIGKPNIYETTDDFLLKFGLKSLEDLPIIDNESYETNFLEERD